MFVCNVAECREEGFDCWEGGEFLQYVLLYLRDLYLHVDQPRVVCVYSLVGQAVLRVNLQGAGVAGE
jgi:hypothetical protein